MKESFRLVAAVTVICLVSALLVSVAHELTQGPIHRTQTRLEQAAILAVLPAGATEPVAQSVVVSWPAGGVTTNDFWRTETGVAMRMNAPNGYSGPIELMLGFTRDGTFWSYTVLAHAETPGLGAHVDGLFVDHVRERPASTTRWRTTKDGGDIVPITAATISSRAICDAIARGVVVYEAIMAREAR